MGQLLTKMTKTPSPSDIKTDWFLMDAKGAVLGRLASKAAEILSGKGKPKFTAATPIGDQLVVINAKHVAVTGRKEEKEYFRHSGYPGGVRITTLSALRRENPERIIREAVSGMLPKNRLRAKALRKLHIFPDADHGFNDKNPTEVTIG
jgi:large subunit ribosomal protein L13